MATDIGAVIGIDGEKAFRTSLAAVNAQLKNLGSEMKAVVSEFAGMEDSQEAVTKKNDVLGRSMQASADKIELLQGQTDRARKRLEELADALEENRKEFGDNSEAVLKAQNAYNKQVAVVNKLESQMNDTRAAMNRMEREMKEVEDAAEDMADGLEEAGQEAVRAKVSLGDVFRIGATAGMVQSMVDGISSLVDSTSEYRKVMGTLNTSSQKAGYTAEQTAETYNQLYGILGDNQSAATAAANLQALGLSQEQLKKMTDGAIGAWATYGDSIPIDGLAEAINETIKAGTVTGSFADVLNWAGTSEDEFNAKLETAGSEAERVNLVLEELANQGLMDAAESWRLNNEEILAANEATAALEETAGRLGTMLSPIVTKLKEGLNAILSTVLDLISEGNPLISVITGVSTALALMGLATFLTQGSLVVDMIAKMKVGFEALTLAMKANPILLVVSLLAGLAAALVTAYQTNEEFRMKVDETWLMLKESLFAAIETVKGYIDGLKEKFLLFIEWLSDLPKEMQEIGRNVIIGLWNGIQEKLEWVKEKVRAAVAAIKDMFTGITGFDTHSPSRWSADVAGNVLKGIVNKFQSDTSAATAAGNVVEGIKNRMQNSLRSVGDSMASVVSAPRVATAAAGVSSSHSYAFGDINIHIDKISSEREAKTLAREIEFIRRQEAAGKGGIT